ncbi:MAG: DUF1614 domain-containing protein [Deltaproteobacteria bacterium]|nr:DUF1614 domain-containing protein [Deltaproteobacteria bacterium]
MSPMHIGLLGLVLLFLIAMLEVGIIESAYQKLGMSHRAVTLLLLLSIFGSYINIPVATISAISPPLAAPHYHIYNLSYIAALLPGADDTIIAVNLGGAVIPVLLSMYLLMRIGGVAPAFIATVVVALLVHHFSRVVPGAGIAVPTFIPGFAAAILAILLTRKRRPVVAYVAGTIGCLVGADVLNLALIARLNAPVASIGGAGTFDGVFVSGVIAVLLA